MAELIVNTGAVLQNYRRYAAHSQVIPVLKGNAYGLGAHPLQRGSRPLRLRHTGGGIGPGPAGDRPAFDVLRP